MASKTFPNITWKCYLEQFVFCRENMCLEVCVVKRLKCSSPQPHNLFCSSLVDIFQAKLWFTIETRKHTQTYGRVAKSKNKSLFILSGAAEVSDSTMVVQWCGQKILKWLFSSTVNGQKVLISLRKEQLCQWFQQKFFPKSTPFISSYEVMKLNNGWSSIIRAACWCSMIIFIQNHGENIWGKCWMLDI